MRKTPSIVHTTGEPLNMPSDMHPRADQAQGTTLDVLAEVAGRVCYDSFGKGRSSADFHKHIREARHYSVYEHCVFSVVVSPWSGDLAQVLLGRPGVWVESSPPFVDRDDAGKISGVALPTAAVCMNLRVLIEWDEWTRALNLREYHSAMSDDFARAVRSHVTRSGVIELSAPPEWLQEARPSRLFQVTFADPRALCPEMRWVSVRLIGSRGFSHEMIRHRFRTAVSQRSTRYCDETDSPWCWHPLIREYSRELKSRQLDDVMSVCRATYADLVSRLESFCIAEGADKFTARKQARGAARGVLGNALETEMVFSASVAQWRRIFAQRCTPRADGEIREIMEETRRLLTERGVYADASDASGD